MSDLDPTQFDFGRPRSRPRPRPRILPRLLARAAIYAALAVGMWKAGEWILSRPPGPPRPAAAAAPAREPDGIAALHCAQDFMKGHLVAPASASWPSVVFGDAARHASRQADGSWLVRSWVDSQNRFGAKIRTHFTVRLDVAAGGGYRVLEWAADP